MIITNLKEQVVQNQIILDSHNDNNEEMQEKINT